MYMSVKVDSLEDLVHDFEISPPSKWRHYVELPNGITLVGQSDARRVINDPVGGQRWGEQVFQLWAVPTATGSLQREVLAAMVIAWGEDDPVILEKAFKKLAARAEFAATTQHIRDTKWRGYVEYSVLASVLADLVADLAAAPSVWNPKHVAPNPGTYPLIRALVGAGIDREEVREVIDAIIHASTDDTREWVDTSAARWVNEACGYPRTAYEEEEQEKDDKKDDIRVIQHLVHTRTLPGWKGPFNEPQPLPKAEKLADLVNVTTLVDKLRANEQKAIRERNDAIRRTRQAGMAVKEIADNTGLTAIAVYKILEEAGADMPEQRAQTAVDTESSQHALVLAQTVASAEDLKKEKRLALEDRNKNIADAYQQGTPVADIAAAAEITTANVYKILDQAGIPRKRETTE